MKTVEFYSTDFVFAVGGFYDLPFVSRAPGGQVQEFRDAESRALERVAPSRSRLGNENSIGTP